MWRLQVFSGMYVCVCVCVCVLMASGILLDIFPHKSRPRLHFTHTHPTHHTHPPHTTTHTHTHTQTHTQHTLKHPQHQNFLSHSHGLSPQYTPPLYKKHTHTHTHTY